MGASRWNYLPPQYSAALRIADGQGIASFTRVGADIGGKMLDADRRNSANELAIAMTQHVLQVDADFDYPRAWLDTMALLSRLVADSLTARVAIDEIAGPFQGHLEAVTDPTAKAALLVDYFRALQPAEVFNQERIRWLLDQLLILESDPDRVMGLVELGQELAGLGNTQDLHNTVQQIIPLIPTIESPIVRARVYAEVSQFSRIIGRQGDAAAMHNSVLDTFSGERLSVADHERSALSRLLTIQLERIDYATAIAIVNMVKPTYIQAESMVMVARHARSTGRTQAADQYADIAVTMTEQIESQARRRETLNALLDLAGEWQDVSLISDLEPELIQTCPELENGNTVGDSPEAAGDAAADAAGRPDPCISLEAARIGALLLSGEDQAVETAIARADSLKGRAWGSLLVAEQLTKIEATEHANRVADWALANPTEFITVPTERASRWAVVFADLERYLDAMETVAEAGSADSAIQVFLSIPPDYSLSSAELDLIDRIRTYF